MEYSDRGEGNKSNGRQDRWQKVAGEMIDRRRVQKMSGQRSKVGERLGLQISHNLKVGGSMDNGKQAHVIISKRRTSHPTCLNDKLILEKQKEDGNQSSCGYGLHVVATKSPDKDPNRGRAASIDMIPNQILVRNSDQRVVSFSDNDGRLMSLPLNGPIQLLLKDGQRGQIRGKDFLEVPLAVEIEGMVISEQRASAIGVAGPKTKSARCY
ncbi:hypothetical protein QYF36_025427 [Acer negundo]|nr:hypothetical protein QYF36_025427 [Acer negundo]